MIYAYLLLKLYFGKIKKSTIPNQENSCYKSLEESALMRSIGKLLGYPRVK